MSFVRQGSAERSLGEFDLDNRSRSFGRRDQRVDVGPLGRVQNSFEIKATRDVLWQAQDSTSGHHPRRHFRIEQEEEVERKSLRRRQMVEVLVELPATLTLRAPERLADGGHDVELTPLRRQ